MIRSFAFPRNLRPSVRTHGDVIASCLARPMSSNSIRELKRERLLPKSWVDLVEFSSVPVDSGNSECAQPDLTLIGRLADELVCRYTVTHHNGSVRVVAGGPTVSEFDSAELHDSALRAVALQRRLIGISEEVTPPMGNKSQTLDTGGEIGIHVACGEPTETSVKRRALLRPGTAKGATRTVRSEVRWDEYAEAYDVMCSANPAYAENLNIFRAWIDGLSLPPNAKVCDVGAGAGNYVLEIATRFPQSSVIHLDSDPMMNRAASRKYRARGATNVGFTTSDASSASLQRVNLRRGRMCERALRIRLRGTQHWRDSTHWLKPAGYLFLIDLGRPNECGGLVSGTSLRQASKRVGTLPRLRGRSSGVEKPLDKID